MKGFTLIEILITTAIFVVIGSIIVGTIFISAKVASDGQDVMELMQNGRVVLDLVSREIRQARKIATDLGDKKESSLDEILFQDGHLKEITEIKNAIGGENDFIIFPASSSDEDDFYKDAFLKVIDGPSEMVGQIRKIVSYDGDNKTAYLESPIRDNQSYFGLEYMIDTSHYYIHYFLTGEGNIKRAVYSYYLSESPNIYVPHNAVAPDGQTLEKEIIDTPKIVAEYFDDIKFWDSGAINILVNLKIEDKEIILLKEVFGRNL